MTVEKSPIRPRKTAQLVRWSVLTLILIGVTAIGLAHQYLSTGKPVGVDALCPFGGLETLVSLIAGGELIKRVAWSSVFLLGATVATAVVFRRAFCGRICPLGFLQELFGRVGSAIFKRRMTVPQALDRPARYLKYAVLAVVLWLTWTAADLIIRPYDPWATYMHLTSDDLFAEFGIGAAVLGVSLVGSLLYDRFFCKYACPMGAFLGLISRFSIFKVRRNAATCIDCKLCDRACPTNVTISTVETVTTPECIDCGECVAACPVKDTLAVRTAGATRLTPVAASALSVGMFALLVAGASATGQFEWATQSLAERVEEAAEDAGASGSDAWFDSSLIKGSTTIEEIVEAAGIPAGVFTGVYGVPDAEQSASLGDLRDRYGCYPGDVRAFVDAYRADPTVAATWVPGQAHEEGTESH